MANFRNFLGFNLCALRLGLCIWLVIKGYENFTVFLQIGLQALGAIIACFITNVREENHDYSTSKKERKNYYRKIYIWVIILLANALWIITGTLYKEEIGEIIDVTYLLIIVAVLAVLDMIFIKPKNMKYMCKSTDKDRDDYYQAVSKV